MSWLCVDKDGSEWIFDKKPHRREIKVGKVLSEDEFKKLKRLNSSLEEYENPDKYELCVWGMKKEYPFTKDDYSVEAPFGLLYIFKCKLPKGSIKKLIGYDLTWEDEPVKI